MSDDIQIDDIHGKIEDVDLKKQMLYRLFYERYYRSCSS